MEKLKASTSKWRVAIINGEWISNGHIALRKTEFKRTIQKFENFVDGRYEKRGSAFVKIAHKAPDIESVVPRNLERYKKVELDGSLMMSDCRTKIIAGHVGNGHVRVSIDYLPFMNGWEIFAAGENDAIVLKDRDGGVVGVVMPMRK